MVNSFKGRGIVDIAPDASSFECVALVKPGSKIDRAWKLAKPAFCIYEYTAWAAEHQKHEIRWGDGSWQRLAPEDFDSLVLLREFGEEALQALFDPETPPDTDARA